MYSTYILHIKYMPKKWYKTIKISKQVFVKYKAKKEHCAKFHNYHTWKSPIHVKPESPFSNILVSRLTLRPLCAGG